MKKEQEKVILKKALSHYGASAQKLMLFEEMGELMQAISKHVRSGGYLADKVISEIVDVEIMLDQMKIIFNASDFDILKDEKLVRLNIRIDEDIYSRSQK